MTTVHRTHRWQTIFIVALVTSSAGVYLKQPSLLLTSVVSIVYVTYPLLTSEPAVDLALSRTLTDGTPEHDDSVTVTVTVTNTGRQTLFDVRLIDGVPPLLAVTDGTARHTATLRPGKSTTFHYTVRAKYGTHQFEPATAVVYDICASTRVQTEISSKAQSAIEETLECTVDIRNFTLQQTQRYTGQTSAAVGGSGIEFYQTRAYQRGDSANRIDWRRFARTGDLTTVEFREARLTTVILCIDAREAAFRTRQATEPHAVSYSVAAATKVASLLSERSVRIGVAIIGNEFKWLAPGIGQYHQAEISHLLKNHQTCSVTSAQSIQDTDPSDQISRFLARSGKNVDVTLFTPLLDDFGVTAAQHLMVDGHTPTVVSPDVSMDETLGTELAQIERKNRIQMLRDVQIPVCNWQPGNPVVWPSR